MKKVLGILGLLVFVSTFTALANPNFYGEYNLQNIVRWTSLFAILSIGVSFVIITGGIDLSIGSVVGLVGVLLPKFMVEAGWDPWLSIAMVIGISLGIGLLHGLLITRLGLQPFVVTLCGLLFYRGYARYLAADQTLGFGNDFGAVRELAKGRPYSLAWLTMVIGVGALAVYAYRDLWVGRNGKKRLGRVISAAAVAAAGGAVWWFDVLPLAAIEAPNPLLIMMTLGLMASVFLNHTVWGRYLFALGRNETAARYSGINTQRMTVLAYVLCSGVAGVGGVLFAFDLNSIQPAGHGNFYELYAIAAAVLGGCSLRGGEGTILGVIIGAAVMRVLYNSINMLKIPTQLEFAIIGAVILLGVVADEVVKRVVAYRREVSRR